MNTPEQRLHGGEGDCDTGGRSGEAPSVLIVDDEPDNLIILGEALEQGGFRVRSALDGRLARQSIAAGTPDLVLLDIRLPDDDGYVLCRELRAAPCTERVPVIFVSALDGGWDKSQAFAAGGDDYVVKPFDLDEVLARVRVHLDRARLTLALEAEISRRQLLEEALRARHDALESEASALAEACDQASAVARAKGELLASASHDLRQPLQALTLFLDTLSGHVSASGRPWLERAQAASHSLAQMLRSALDLSLLEAGALSPSPRVVDLGALLGALAGELEPRVVRAGLVWRSDWPEGLAVETDPQLLERILRNLLENALRYTPEGSVGLRAGFGSDDVWVEVVDSGPGLAVAEREELFQAYRRGDNTQDPDSLTAAHAFGERGPNEGLGLGLAIVRGLSDLLGVGLELDSTPGVGTTFRVRLPKGAVHACQREAQPDPGAAPGTVGARAEPESSQERVLVVDDDVAVAVSIRGCLEGWGYRPTMVSSVSEALGAIDRARFAAVVSDHRLPDGWGLDLLRRIHARASDTRPRCLLLTADADPAIAASARKTGIAVLLKPWQPARLRAWLRA